MKHFKQISLVFEAVFVAVAAGFYSCSNQEFIIRINNKHKFIKQLSMKKNIFNTFVIVILFLGAHLNSTAQNCIQCDTNSNPSGDYASVMGMSTTATGDYSFAGGINSVSEGYSSFAFGNNARAEGLSSISLMKDSQASGMYSFAVGFGSIASGSPAFALGYKNLAQAGLSYVIGNYLKTTASGSIIIGIGAGSGNDYLKNNETYSLMVGFKSNVPTLFVGSSAGSGTTGKIGIGNVTDPEAKLHIKADIDEPATLFIQPYDTLENAQLYLGTKNYGLQYTPSRLEFLTGDKYIFDQGNVGIGTHTPIAKVQIKDGDIFIEDIDRGIVMKSPDGNCWRGTIDNSGVLQFVQVNCDDLQTGTEEQPIGEKPQVKIYPNPAGNHVFVSIGQKNAGAFLEVVDLNGRTIYSEALANTESYIDLSTYPSGVYMFKIIEANGKIIESTKVIKK